MVVLLRCAGVVAALVLRIDAETEVGGKADPVARRGAVADRINVMT
jgi:hypothetical protein